MPVIQSSKSVLADEALLAEALRVLIPTRQVTEVRALDARMPGVQYPRTISGYFDDPAAMIGAVGTLTSAKGIYLMPNPVAPALLARAANRIWAVYKEPLTSDAAIDGAAGTTQVVRRQAIDRVVDAFRAKYYRYIRVDEKSGAQ